MNKMVIFIFVGYLLGVSLAWSNVMFDIYHIPILIWVLCFMCCGILLRERRNVIITFFLMIFGFCTAYPYTLYVYEVFHAKTNLVCGKKKCTTNGVVNYLKEQTIERTILDLNNQGIITRHYIHKTHEIIRVGDTVSVEGQYSHDTGFKDESGHLINMRSYFIGEGISGVSYRSKLLTLKKNEISPYSIYGIARLRQILTNNLTIMLGGIGGPLSSGIVLGDGSLLTKQIKSDFSSASLSHILVASGYNISIVIEQVSVLIGNSLLSSIMLFLVIVSLVIFYGTGPSILRAGIMASIIVFRNKLGRNTESIYVLCIAVFLMLAWNPLLLLHSLSFQLSVMATGGILVLESLFKRFLFKNSRKFSFVTESITVSLSAFIGTLPIIVESFGVISLFGIILNILVGILLPFYYFGTLLLLILNCILGSIGWLQDICKTLYQYLYYVVKFFAELQLGFLEEYVWYFSIFTWVVWLLCMAYAYLYKD